MKELGYRFLVNGVGAVLIAFVIFFAQNALFSWFFVAAVASTAAIALWEFYQLTYRKGFHPATFIGIVTTILYIFAIFYKTQGPHPYWESFWYRMPEVTLALAFFSCFVYYALNDKSPIVNIAVTLMGVIYIAIPMGLIIREVYFFQYNGQIDRYYQGSWWIIYLITVTKSADMGGYFVGRFFGRKKIAHRVSPNKTLEGALAGLVSSMLISVFVCYLGKHFNAFVGFTYVSSIWFGLIVGFIGQLGDLAESMLKRDADVKDSNIIPGVGGILDMADSILFTSPVVYFFLRVLYT
ncbi:MAG: hypothetical protein S4CHLAM45_00100 [Chlamydiales bacterium]|nr:hypothetical protein [Chlamydiales bacterium]MCH9619335.1 hypothetical protein [Chlamydiales bacterium]MCH9622139.1 hypothetical protein [Chlamydiales bacterium]